VAEEIVRRRMSVPGTWAYARQGDLVIFMFDLCYTDDEIRKLVARVMSKPSVDNGGDRTSR
jgi:hypothetical protein